jgi:protein-L-isoaspartate(D-aspartate) O-methyltransferase
MNYTPQQARDSMVRHQVRCWDVLDQRVLDVLERLPRDAFVADEYRRVAYADTQIPLGRGEVMMAPSVEGRLLQALDIAPGDEVLEIGCGSGFLTACLAALGGRVSSIDIHEDFVALAGRHLAEQGIANCDLKTEDAFSRSDSARFDAIAVTGSMPNYRGEFDGWLKPGGRLFIIEGRGNLMEALLLRQTSAGIQRESLFETRLPPLLNAPNHAGFSF